MIDRIHSYMITAKLRGGSVCLQQKVRQSKAKKKKRGKKGKVQDVNTTPPNDTKEGI